MTMDAINALLNRIGRAVGGVVGALYQAGRDSIDTVIRNVTINPQVGCDFIPVGLALGEAEEHTVEVGVPAVLFSRLITGPVAVVIAYLASFGLYTGK